MASGISLKGEDRRRHVILFVMGGVMLATSAAVSNVRALFAPGDLAAAIQEQQGGAAFAAFAGDPLGVGDRRLAPAARFIRGGNRVPGGAGAGTGSDQVPGLTGDEGGNGLSSAGNPPGAQTFAIGPDGGAPGTSGGNSGSGGNTGGGDGPGFGGTPGGGTSGGGSSGGGGGQGPSDGGEVSPPFTPTPSTPTPTEPLPEPETWAMMLLGIGFSGWMARRARRGAMPA